MSGELANLFTAGLNFGGLGLLVYFLMWQHNKNEAARAKLEAQIKELEAEHKAATLLADGRRLDYDRERLEADKGLAASFATLTAAIQNLERRQ